MRFIAESSTSKNLWLLLHQFFLRGQRVMSGSFHRDGILAALCLIHQPIRPANRMFSIGSARDCIVPPMLSEIRKCE